jgi:hypothetical protein
LIRDAEQYSELVRLYGEYGDDELIALGRQVGDLTETAQEALKGELARRRLSVSPEVKEPVVEEDEVEEEDDRLLPSGSGGLRRKIASPSLLRAKMRWQRVRCFGPKGLSAR